MGRDLACLKESHRGIIAIQAKYHAPTGAGVKPIIVPPRKAKTILEIGKKLSRIDMKNISGDRPNSNKM
jgi:hypothetical protein